VPTIATVEWVLTTAKVVYGDSEIIETAEAMKSFVGLTEAGGQFLDQLPLSAMAGCSAQTEEAVAMVYIDGMVVIGTAFRAGLLESAAVTGSLG